jgi:hypothetical protein
VDTAERSGAFRAFVDRVVDETEGELDEDEAEGGEADELVGGR